jgi:hypothetical protein
MIALRLGEIVMGASVHQLERLFHLALVEQTDCLDTGSDLL